MYSQQIIRPRWEDRLIVEESISRYWTAVGVEVHYSTEKTQVFSGIKHPYFNGIIRSVMPLRVAVKRVRDLISQFDDRKLPFRWLVNKSSLPGNLKKILTEQGMRHHGTFTGLIHYPESFIGDVENHQGYRLVVVTNSDMMLIWSQHLADAIGISVSEGKSFAKFFAESKFGDFQHFMVFHGEECVAVATLYYNETASTIHNLTVKEGFRGKGVAALTVRFLLSHIYKYSAKKVVHFSPKQTVNDFIEMGFDPVTEIEIFEK
ncbi:MAG: GNAT family N-acetyltransferase [Chlamydiota bacterium]|nr:GNAT family N-acetyltransferase [Chlamydiota bacterium]